LEGKGSDIRPRDRPSDETKSNTEEGSGSADAPTKHISDSTSGKKDE